MPAKRDLSEYLRRYPHALEGWLLKGNISLQLNETANAQRAFAQALELNPSDERALLGLGVVARRNHQYELAEDYYYRVLKANPTSYSAKSNLLILEILNGNLDTAVSLGEDAWRAADKSKPEQLSIGANLAIAYYENGQIEQCRQVMQQLEALDYRGTKYLHQYLEGEISLSDIF